MSKDPDELASHIHPEDLPGVRRVFEPAIHDGTDYQIEYRTRFPDGSYFWRRQQSHVSKVDGELVLVAGAIIDIHDDIDKEKRLVDELQVNAAAMRMAEQAGLRIHDHGT